MSWRDTLFVWRGDVEYGTCITDGELWRGQPIKGSTFMHLTSPEFEWKGRWIGVDSADATKADMPHDEGTARMAGVFAFPDFFEYPPYFT